MEKTLKDEDKQFAQSFLETTHLGLPTMHDYLVPTTPTVTFNGHQLGCRPAHYIGEPHRDFGFKTADVTDLLSGPLIVSPFCTI
jgi:hypothetical protein